MSSRLYLKILFGILGLILVTSVIYAVWFSRHYPLPVTSRISFDAKIKFIREHIDPDMVDTLIVGSSIGLNDVQGVYLQKSCNKCKHVLNLSVYEASTLQVEQLLQLIGAFPNLKRIIYSAQYSDFPYHTQFTDYDPKFLSRYMRHELNPIEYWALLFRSCRDLFFCFHRQMEWHDKHGMSNKFPYLGFDSTGSVPLHIYGKDIIHHRWVLPHPPSRNMESYKTVDRISKMAQQKGIKFYFVQQPYRAPLVQKYKHVRDSMAFFSTQIDQIMKKNGGSFLSLHQALHLSDKYFADRSHLNDQGSRIGAEAIGHFIDAHEK
jgi:hypothetical protein